MLATTWDARAMGRGLELPSYPCCRGEATEGWVLELGRAPSWGDLKQFCLFLIISFPLLCCPFPSPEERAQWHGPHFLHGWGKRGEDAGTGVCPALKPC